MLLWLVACGSSGVIVLTDADNHAAERRVSLPVIAADSTSDVRFALGGVEQDVRCRAAPTENRSLQLIRLLDLTAEQAMARLEGDGMLARDYDLVVSYELAADETEVRLSAMDFFGVEPGLEALGDDTVFLLALSSGDSGRWISLALLDGTPDGAETVAMPDGCGLYDTTAWIPEEGLRFRDPEGLSWAELTQDAFGGHFDRRHSVESVEIAHFGGMSVGDLEDRYLQLDLLADQRWSISVENGTSIGREELEGIDVSREDGTWVLALLGADGIPDFLTVLTD